MKKTADPFEMFPLIAPSLPEDYAIGGAFAMAAHGYTRQTEDIDVFMLQKDRNKVLNSLRKRGVKFWEIADPCHYAIVPDGRNIARRIDLLFTSDDIEVDAVTFPQMLDVHDDTVNVFPLELLVAAKADSDREKDHDDVKRMYGLGMFEPDEIVKLLRGYGAKKPRRILEAVIGKWR